MANSFTSNYSALSSGDYQQISQQLFLHFSSTDSGIKLPDLSFSPLVSCPGITLSLTALTDPLFLWRWFVG
jgi:hypothetical protein